MYCCWDCKLIQPLWKTVCRMLKKLKIELSGDLAILLWGIYSEETQTLSQKDICTRPSPPAMFIAALFIIAKTWKQPKCPSTDNWFKKV